MKNTGLAIAALVALSSPSFAADLPVKAPPAPPPVSPAGFYIGAGGGLNWTSNYSARPDLLNISSALLQAPNQFSFSTDVGGLALANLGWAFGNGWRIEGEINYRSNGIDSAGTTYGFATTNDNRTGRISSEGVMANALYDIGSTLGWPVYLTVGAGAGYAWVHYDDVGVRALDGLNGFQTVKLGDTVGNFAWQGIAGLTLPVRAVPGLELSLEYRHFETLAHDHQGPVVQGGLIPPSVNSTATARINTDYKNDSVLFGVRYKFGARPVVAKY